MDGRAASPESGLAGVQFPSLLQPVLQSLLDGVFGQFACDGQEADRAVAGWLGGRLPFLGMATISAVIQLAGTSAAVQDLFTSFRSSDLPLGLSSAVAIVGEGIISKNL